MAEREPPTCLVDGVPATGLPLDDRGLAYGDGVFETVLLHRGQPVWWQAHLERLRLGAGRLGIAAPDDACWAAELDRLLHPAPPRPRELVKLLLTRGSGGRGYLTPEAAAPRRILLRLPAPADEPGWRRDGIALHDCATRLALQPALAGIKHLNRLEQVLARSEWRDPAIAEGLMRDAEGGLVCATAANLFIVVDGRLRTPAVDRCGVAGVCRRFLLEAAGADECRLPIEALRAADEVFVCSSVRGILPVRALAKLQWPVGPVTRRLIGRLADAQPAFAFPDIAA